MANPHSSCHECSTNSGKTTTVGCTQCDTGLVVRCLTCNKNRGSCGECGKSAETPPVSRPPVEFGSGPTGLWGC